MRKGPRCHAMTTSCFLASPGAAASLGKRGSSSGAYSGLWVPLDAVACPAPPKHAASRGRASKAAPAAAMSMGPQVAAAEVEAAPVPLLTPYKMGIFDLSMRIVYAPLTRNRATNSVPQPNAAVYYSQRAHPGQLLITEATVVSPDGHGYPNTPGIYTDEQVEAWKPIVQAVHDKGAFLFLQIWHTGRASHPDFMPDGESLPLAPSPIPISDNYTIYTPKGVRKPVVPKEMTKADIERIVDAYRQGARRAREAGFDGVEIHGANGYIVDQFLKDGCNKRTDEYGGPIENRARFPLAVAKACADEIGKERVGIRLSPYEGYLESADSNPLETNLYMLQKLEEMGGLAYVHLTEARASQTLKEGEEPTETLEPFRKAWKGTFIAAGGFTRESGIAAIKSGHADLVAYGRWYLANPDLPERFRLNAPLNPYDRDTFYANEQVKGYIDYPFLNQEEAVAASS